MKLGGLDSVERNGIYSTSGLEWNGGSLAQCMYKKGVPTKLIVTDN